MSQIAAEYQDVSRARDQENAPSRFRTGPMPLCESADITYNEACRRAKNRPMTGDPLSLGKYDEYPGTFGFLP